MRLQNPEIRFEVTNKCNAHCVMCPREKMTRPQGFMDMNLYRRLIDEVADLGAEIISLGNFGETFLDPFIFARGEYAKNKGLKVYTLTNGSLLYPAACEKIVSCFNKVRISMYGLTKETYEKVHVGLSFEKTKENIENLFKANVAKKVQIEIYFLLLKENEHEMQDFLAQYEHRANLVSIWKPHNWSDGRNYRKPSDNQEKISCNRPQTGPLQIQWNGLVTPCCYDYDTKIILGDLNKQSVTEVLTGDSYKKIREAHLSKNFSLYYNCGICDQLTKKEDVLVYTTSKEVKVGAVNTTFFDLEKKS